LPLNEADTRAKLIDPMLKTAGWEESQIRREVYLTSGRILDERGNRKEGKKADYILYYGGTSIAVVEAKDELHAAYDGIQQSMQYAKMLDIPFAYSCNGHEIEEFNFISNDYAKPKRIRFPSPEELWSRYNSQKPKRLKTGVDPLAFPYYVADKAPRYYQEAAIKKSIESFLSNRKKMLLTMATGTGKTFVAFQIVWKLYKAGAIRRILYIADRTFLRDQAYNVFAPFANSPEGDPRDVIREGIAGKNRDIYFATYQSLFSGTEGKRLFQQYNKDFYDMIIIDECHRSGFGIWKVIFEHFSDAVYLGMTATPKRDDNIDTYAYFGEPVFSYSLGQGIEDGFLAPYRIHKIFTNIDKDGILFLRQAQDSGASLYIPENVDIKDYYSVGEFEEKITLPDRTKKMCEHLADLLRIYGPKDKTMIFCVNMHHAGEVAKELQSHFSYLGYPDYAVRIVSEEAYVNSLLEKFVDSEKVTPVVATTVDLLSTGVDAPSVKNIVFMAPIASKVLFKQTIGRGSRIDPITKKFEFRIIDYTNVTRLFDEWDYPIDTDLTSTGPKDKFLHGSVVDAETGIPIANASLTIKLGTNEQVAVKVDNQGKFRISNLPGTISLRIHSNGYKDKSLTTETFANYNQSILIELRKKTEEPERIVVDGLPIYISEEINLELADGQTLSKAEYVEYSRNEIRKRTVSLDDLRRIWVDKEKRTTFLQELRGRSISPKVLSDIVKNPDTDIFDLVAHVAFNAPLITRDERARAFRLLKTDFVNSLGSGKDVILALLEKYRVAGIENISDPKVFNLPPFDKMGHVIGVAKMVGGIDKLKQMIELLERDIYEERND